MAKIRPICANEHVALGDRAQMTSPDGRVISAVVVDYAATLTEDEREVYPSPCLWWATGDGE